MLNERIEELANKAGFKILTDGRIIPTLDHNGECGRDLQKFAELLVKECSDVAVNAHGIREAQGHSVSKQIKEHFGVEE
jgi:hypothetical protein